MFIGEHQHNLDDKGRLQVPAKWRSALAEGAVVTKGFDGSLTLFPVQVWRERAETLATLPQSDPLVRRYVRQQLAGAVDVAVDGSGRIVLPQYLREYADMKREVIVTGSYRYIELWAVSRWQSYEKTMNQDTEALQKALGELGM